MLSVPGEEPSSSTSKSMAKGTIISHTHKLINIFLSPTSHHPLPSSLPPSKPYSDELPNRTQKTPRLDQDEDDSNSSTSSAYFIADNEDLLIQILVYLPPKSLVRFQSVSKRWLSIIADPFFRRLHFTVTSSGTACGAHFLYRKGMDNTPELNFITYREEYVDPMVNTVSHFRNLFNVSQILGFHSCNGLVAIALNSNTGAGGFVEFFVYNPGTHQHRLIPTLYVPHIYDYYVPDIYDNGYYDPDSYQVFCPQSPHHFIALNVAFDPLQSDHYTLVYVWYDDGEIRFATYASETRVWRDCLCRLQDHEYLIFRKGILWNGNLHWASEWGGVLCFDLESGCDKPIMASLPQAVVLLPGEEEEHVYWPEIFFFGVSGGDLCLGGLKESQSLLFDVFKMELDYSRWSVKYCLDLSPLTTLYPLMADEESDPYRAWWRCKFSVLSCNVDNKKKQPVLMISVRGKVMSCDMQGMIVKEIAHVVPENSQDHDMSRYGWKEAFQHVETLASV